jgi:hypothetical protein
LQNGFGNGRKNLPIRSWPYCSEANNRFVKGILYGGGMSSVQMFKVALSREAIKYYSFTAWTSLQIISTD